MIRDHKPNVYAATAYNSEHLPILTEDDIPERKKELLGKPLPFGHTDITTVPYYIYDTENPASINETESKTDEELIENSEKSHIKIDMK